MKRVATFAAVSVAMIGLAAWVITLVVKTPGAAAAIWTSAAVALVVQVASFSFTRFTQPVNVVAGWGSGMLVRFIVLVVYGVVGARALGVALTPALLSLAGFFFLTTLVEPVFLKP
jgi:hypothetical protein